MEPSFSKEAAQILKIKKTTLYTWAYRRQIPIVKVGSALRFRQSDLEKWLKSQARAGSWSYFNNEATLRISPHPDPERMTSDVLRLAIAEAEEQMKSRP